MSGGWWRTHFSAETLSGYSLGPKTRKEAAGVVKLLQLPRAARILDLCCGAGRHSLVLAGRGYRVTGLEYQASLVAAARAEAERLGVSAEFVRGDARRARFPRKFDAVLNLFTSFGYFQTEAEDLALLETARHALKPGGALLVDILNKEWLIRHFTPSFLQKGEGPVRSFLNRQEFDLERGRLITRRTLRMKDGRRKETVLSIRLYTLAELIRLLGLAGLRFEKAYGGFDRRRYGLDTFRMIVRGRRIK
ncbi:MAG: methyltransferase domain-containing protein [Elusimicrobia bacterium]|nr:methyltransferase domain-containing protein [Elusimicrobiota bacterium]